MTVETLRIICEGLNSEPFSQNLTPIKLDAQTPEKLLQHLSDVVEWVQGAEFIDIRSENPDETAIRILNALRIFKYPPPRDIDQIQKWRLEILEGHKSTIYAVLEWIFENVNRLKERVYLARYLTKIEVPPEAQSPDVLRLENLVNEKMEEFKTIHSQIVENRADFVRAEDVQADLKAMEEEKEQLLRKIERSRRKVSRYPDLDKYLEVTARLHAEMERQEELQIQHQEQQNALVHACQRLTRLEKTLNDLEREHHMNDAESIISKLKGDIEVSRYVLEEKLASNIATQHANIEAVQKILSMRNVDKNDIALLQKKIEQINAEIADIHLQQEKKVDGIDDRLTIYRHQLTNILRKKGNIADTLQSKKQELEDIEKILAVKRKEITEKFGKDEIISSVQYKAYMKKLRNKNNFYKQKKIELEQSKAEIQILERTVELLEQRLKELRQQCKNEGHSFIETIDDVNRNEKSNRRPQTAKPSTTSIIELKKMVEQLNLQLNEKRNSVQSLSDEIDNFYQEHKEQNEVFYAKQAEIDSVNLQLENNKKSLEKDIYKLKSTIKNKRDELTKISENISKLDWFIEILNKTNDGEHLLEKLDRQNMEHSKAISELKRELDNAEQDQLSINQVTMWNSLVKIFKLKIRIYQQKRDSEVRSVGNILY